MRSALIALLLLWANHAHAHPMSLGSLSLREQPDGHVEGLYRFSGTESRAVGAEPFFPEHCRIEGVTRERALPQGGIERSVSLDCGSSGLRSGSISIRGLEGSGVSIVVSIEHSDGSTQRALFDDETRTLELRTTSIFDTLRTFFLFGLEHIALGLDHLLFVLGLFLLASSSRQLLALVTAFTLGHSVTLALSALEVFRVRSPPVEACIALSILALALELLEEREHRSRSSMLAITVVAFGLLHGLGFAGALAEEGWRGQAVLPALIGFNMGVEAGQVFFVIGCAFVFRARAAVQRPLAYAMGSIAAYLLISRLGELGT